MRNVKVKIVELRSLVPNQTIAGFLDEDNEEADYGIADESREKDMRKFIIPLKSYIKNSYEYKRLIGFLKNSRGLDRCGNHPNITIYDGFGIDIHHAPYTFEDIATTVVRKRCALKEGISYPDIAEEVMYLHYSLLVGLYPYCKSCHGFVSSDEADDFIPFDLLFGEPAQFFEIYRPFMKDNLVTKSNNIMEIDRLYKDIVPLVPEELTKSYIYAVDGKTGTPYMSISKFAEFIDALDEVLK